MAGHEKVYGICENKCFVEVLPKAQAATKTKVDKIDRIVKVLMKLYPNNLIIIDDEYVEIKDGNPRIIIPTNQLQTGTHEYIFALDITGGYVDKFGFTGYHSSHYDDITIKVKINNETVWSSEESGKVYRDDFFEVENLSALDGTEIITAEITRTSHGVDY